MEKNKCGECGKAFGSAEALEQHNEAKHTGKTNGFKKPGRDAKEIAIYGLILVFGALTVYVIATSMSSGSRIGAVGSTHEHIDFIIYIDGTPIDLSKPKYQVASQLIHVENGIGTLMHKHATGVTFVNFLETVNMEMDDKCFNLDNAKRYCNEDGKTLKFYVNGKQDASFGNDELRDLQKIMVSYGNETEEAINKQLATITDLAKKESGK